MKHSAIYYKTNHERDEWAKGIADSILLLNWALHEANYAWMDDYGQYIEEFLRDVIKHQLEKYREIINCPFEAFYADFERLGACHKERNNG